MCRSRVETVLGIPQSFLDARSAAISGSVEVASRVELLMYGSSVSVCLSVCRFISVLPKKGSRILVY